MALLKTISCPNLPIPVICVLHKMFFFFSQPDILLISEPASSERSNSRHHAEHQVHPDLLDMKCNAALYNILHRVFNRELARNKLSWKLK